MVMKRSTRVFAKVLVAALPLVAVATSSAAPQVQFHGEIAGQTCVPVINGNTDGNVFLETVATSELEDAGSTAGFTSFTISVSGCALNKTAALKIDTVFEGHNVTPLGNMQNTLTDDAAENVQIQLVGEDDPDGVAIVLNGLTNVPGLVVAAGQTAASYTYGARYVSETGNAKAGKILTIAEYSLAYP